MRSERRVVLAALGGILALAAVLRIVQLGHDSLWVEADFVGIRVTPYD